MKPEHSDGLEAATFQRFLKVLHASGIILVSIVMEANGPICAGTFVLGKLQGLVVTVKVISGVA